jgi:hypothetical protein
MRRFLITSPAFNGQAEVVYNKDGLLCTIDTRNAEMPIKTIEAFKLKIPVVLVNLQEVFANSKATIIEADFEVTFEMFWNKYDRKINRKRCMPLWDKLSKPDQVQAYYGIDAYDKYLKKESWRSKCDPDKYLRDRYWENEWK